MNTLHDDDSSSLPLDSSAVKEEDDVTPSQPLLFQHHNNINTFNYQSTAKPPLLNQHHSNFVRHSSKLAGLFSQTHIENGFVDMRAMGGLGGVNKSVEEVKFSSTSRTRRFKNPQNYSSSSSSTGRMSSIAEIGYRDNK